MNKVHYESINETIYKETLDNGLTVALLPKQEMSKTFAIFATNYGSIDSNFVPINQDESIHVPEGIAHFLEHKLFEKEDRDVFQDFGKQGASANAFTSFTTTAYLFSATEHIKQNVETLINFVQDPYFSHESVEKEKGIIAQEITMYDDQPDWRSFMGIIKNMFKDHPVHIDIAGTVDSIQDITKDDLYTCYETFYHPENMTLFVAGNFDVEEIAELIQANQTQKEFSKPSEIKRFYPEEPIEVHEKKKVVHMPVSIPKCIIGVKEFGNEIGADQLLEKEILLDMLLDYFYSRGGTFYQELYQNDLIDSSFSAESNVEKNFGFTIIGGNTNDIERFEKTLKDQLLRIKDIEVTNEEFEILKKKKIGEMLRSMNSLEFIATQFIHYHALDIDIFEIIPMIENLTKADFDVFMKNWIDEERLSTFQILQDETNVG